MRRRKLLKSLRKVLPVIAANAPAVVVAVMEVRKALRSDKKAPSEEPA